ncbi:DUF3231 family protein [Cytobacillus gottheilii]|uniref:DUF3231 family protein n=1 Tax=Cytobacillus gottheilii TaxID=859144 RepID=UPI00214800CB|nr:DUF3231 family protein [Cytobacillus gottheilii]
MEDKTKLTASELSVLFGSYMAESVSICVLSYFLQHVQSSAIKPYIQSGLELSQSNYNFIENIFVSEEIPVPDGFTEKDVNIHAERLYTDEFILHYTMNIGLMGVNAYSSALPNAARKDLRAFYSSCLLSSTNLFNQGIDIAQDMGNYILAPYIPYPNGVEYIHSKRFLGGWFGEQRPLTSVEISHLFTNLYRNMLGSVLLMGFAQTANTPEVKKFLKRGTELAKHHCDVFSEFLKESDLFPPANSSISATASTEPVFSDKLIMFHTKALYSAGIAFYGASVGASGRKDLITAYTRLIAEVADYSKDGVSISIERQWLEKPPSAPDRKNL